MGRSGESFGQRIKEDDRERQRREQEGEPIDCGRGSQKKNRTDEEQQANGRFSYQQMSRSSPRIPLIERPIDESIEKHCRGPRADHANKHEKQCSSRREAVRRHHKRTQGKRQRKNRVRETDQPQKATDRVARSRFVLKMSIRQIHRRAMNRLSTSAANAHWRRKESACHGQKEFALPVGSNVPTTIAEGAFRPGNTFGEEPRDLEDQS